MQQFPISSPVAGCRYPVRLLPQRRLVFASHIAPRVQLIDIGGTSRQTAALGSGRHLKSRTSQQLPTGGPSRVRGRRKRLALPR